LHHTVSEGYCKLVQKFKIGDKVKSYGEEYTIHAGPFHGHSEWYAVEDESGRVFQENADAMTAVEPEPEAGFFKVGDKVKILSGRGIDSYIGSTVTLTEVGATNPYGPYGFRSRFGLNIYAEEVERVEDENTVTHDGVVYDLTARYRDKDGDDLRIQLVNGTPKVAWFGALPLSSDYTLKDAVDEYGPFTRI